MIGRRTVAAQGVFLVSGGAAHRPGLFEAVIDDLIDGSEGLANTAGAGGLDRLVQIRTISLKPGFDAAGVGCVDQVIACHQSISLLLL